MFLTDIKGRHLILATPGAPPSRRRVDENASPRNTPAGRRRSQAKFVRGMISSKRQNKLSDFAVGRTYSIGRFEQIQPVARPI
jgi:hypothetical protein